MARKIENLGRILTQHNIDWSYELDGTGIAAVEYWVESATKKRGKTVKHFTTKHSLRAVKNWLGY
jgi:hypothetical protein